MLVPIVGMLCATAVAVAFIIGWFMTADSRRQYRAEMHLQHTDGAVPVDREAAVQPDGEAP